MKFWVSFWGDNTVLPHFEMHRPWWISGEDMAERKAICCAVIAPDEEAVKKYVRSCFDKGKAPDTIEYRFINIRRDDWSPFSDRFPKADWMDWPEDEAEDPLKFQDMHPHTVDAVDVVDAAIFTGCPSAHDTQVLREYCERWLRGLKEHDDARDDVDKEAKHGMV